MNPRATALPPPPKRNGNGVPSQPVETAPVVPATFEITRGRVSLPQRVTVYGPGGIGKSTLCALAPNPVFLDIEGGTNELDIARIAGLSNFASVRECMGSPAIDQFDTVVIDSITKLEELVTAHVISSSTPSAWR